VQYVQEGGLVLGLVNLLFGIIDFFAALALTMLASFLLCDSSTAHRHAYTLDAGFRLLLP
jgi:hypothetical protein